VPSGPAVLLAQAIFAPLTGGTIRIGIACLSRNSWNTRIGMPAVARSTVVVLIGSSRVVVVVTGVAWSAIVFVITVMPAVIVDSSVVAMAAVQLTAAVLALEAEQAIRIELAAHACRSGTCVTAVTTVTRACAMLAFEAAPAVALPLTAAGLIQALRGAWTVARLRAAQLGLRALASACIDSARAREECAPQYDSSRRHERLPVVANRVRGPDLAGSQRLLTRRCGDSPG
jgi:sensor c-di-GMP phosphodiesterase-like protein